MGKGEVLHVHTDREAEVYLLVVCKGKILYFLFLRLSGNSNTACYNQYAGKKAVYMYMRCHNYDKNGKSTGLLLVSSKNKWSVQM